MTEKMIEIYLSNLNTDFCRVIFQRYLKLDFNAIWEDASMVQILNWRSEFLPKSFWF